MDGWNKSKLESLISVLEDCQNYLYEIENCVRGCITGARTYEELGQQIRLVGNRLIEEGSYIEEEVEEDNESYE